MVCDVPLLPTMRQLALETLLLLPLVTPYGSALILLLSLPSFLWYGSYLLSCIPYNNLSSSSMKRLKLWKLPESLSRSWSWFPTPVSFTQASWSGKLCQSFLFFSLILLFFSSMVLSLYNMSHSMLVLHAFIVLGDFSKPFSSFWDKVILGNVRVCWRRFLFPDLVFTGFLKPVFCLHCHFFFII